MWGRILLWASIILVSCALQEMGSAEPIATDGDADVDVDSDTDSDLDGDVAHDGSSPGEDADPDELVPDCEVLPNGPGETVARPTSGVVIDGSMDEWGDAHFIEIDSENGFVGEGGHDLPTGRPDLWARFALLWTPEALYIAVEVEDSEHFNVFDGHDLWMGDSLQAAFDMGHGENEGYDGIDDFEYGWGHSTHGDLSYAWFASGRFGPPAGGFAISQAAPSIVYEVELLASDLGLERFEADSRVGFSLVVNENDGSLREGYLEWGGGVGNGKNPSLFNDLVFRTLPPGCG